MSISPLSSLFAYVLFSSLSSFSFGFSFPSTMRRIANPSSSSYPSHYLPFTLSLTPFFLWLLFLLWHSRLRMRIASCLHTRFFDNFTFVSAIYSFYFVKLLAVKLYRQGLMCVPSCQGWKNCKKNGAMMNDFFFFFQICDSQKLTLEYLLD